MAPINIRLLPLLSGSLPVIDKNLYKSSWLSFFVVIVGLPVYTVAGAALMGTFITSFAGVAFYQYLSLIYTDMAVAPDWLLGILFGFGGFFGMYLGARTQKFVPARLIKGLLCGCVLFVAVRYILGYF
ncbi:MAG: TSUP family transporter [Desulfobacterales bacterium]|nr:TSUP family transporter [Desulfobacterales bacterium]